jgi:hypothetical protein
VDVLDRDRPPEHVTRNGGQVLFDRDHDQERWDVLWRQGQVEVARFIWRGPAVEAPPSSQRGSDIAVVSGKADRDRAVVLALERGGKTSPMSMGTQPKAGDVALAAIDTTRRDEALEWLSAAGWEPAPTASREEAPAASPWVT